MGSNPTGPGASVAKRLKHLALALHLQLSRPPAVLIAFKADSGYSQVRVLPDAFLFVCFYFGGKDGIKTGFIVSIG